MNATKAKTFWRPGYPEANTQDVGVLRDQVSEVRRPESSAYCTPETIGRVRAGFLVRELDALQAGLGLPMDTLAPKLGISKATLHRRRAQGRLRADESDRVLRFERLLELATKVMEGPEAARRWLTSPQFGLGGAIPLDFAETEVGAREVEDLLVRIEYGVYS